MIQTYLNKINTRFKGGYSKEHAYRGDLETLIRELVPGIEITNEPANVTDCGNPDYVITKGKIPIGYIEAKDIGKDLKNKSYKEQFDRYKNALENLIITDYVWFQFFQNGELVHEIRIGEIEDNQIKPLNENFGQFENLIRNFATFIGQTIKSPKKLAEMMAAKAKLLQNILENAVTSDEETQENTSLQGQYETFKNILIHDLTPKGFADIYAQTLAYGMFAARLHDTTLDDFSRQEAAELIPKSNPFLRKLFGYVAGPDIDERILRTVDNLAEVFRATNIRELLKNFGKSTQTHDPIIHFYETFLAEYDPKLRKSRGVWYTPEPVVNFIVRAVDDILKTEFNLEGGLADTTKTKIKVPVPGSKKPMEKEVHKVQILDPATGTGTFLAEVVKFIYNKKFKAMQGAWSSYVDDHLIPRLNGFELLMASYSMAHLKLDILLRETGYNPTKTQRFNIYLTNSLEEHHPDTGTLFSNWLSTEANEANHIKRDTPVMCVIGNPPYSVSSTNKSKWIEKLMNDYKKDLKERNINPLSDDYIKFIRYGQYYINKNGEGILAYISNNSFINGVIHKQMRQSLLESFNKIYIINLHGSSKTNETAPDGSIDENVFDIQQGVSINIFVKSEKSTNKRACVKYLDLWGKRDDKYKTLSENNLENLLMQELEVKKPNNFFYPINNKLKVKFEKGFTPTEVFKLYTSGVQTEFDSIAIQDNIHDSNRIRNDLKSLSIDELIIKYSLTTKHQNKLLKAKEDICENNATIYPYAYRPFEIKSVLYTGKTNGLMGRPRKESMHHMYNQKNFALVLKRARLLGKEKVFNHCFIASHMTDKNFLSDQSYCFPIYLSTNPSKLIESSHEDQCNLDSDFIKRMEKNLAMPFIRKEITEHKEITASSTFTALNILDYIYAILNSPTYREKYKEFLKIDFPRIPYPKDKETFWKLVELGKQIREIHLLESPKTEEYITSYPKDGDNSITRKIAQKDWEITDPEKQLGRIWINDEQYFENIPLIAWEFYIGGYQPAQKWLKDRAPKKGEPGRTLSYEDILHYQKIIVALTETDRLMKEVDKIEIE